MKVVVVEVMRWSENLGGFYATTMDVPNGCA